MSDEEESFVVLSKSSYESDNNNKENGGDPRQSGNFHLDALKYSQIDDQSSSSNDGNNINKMQASNKNEAQDAAFISAAAEVFVSRDEMIWKSTNILQSLDSNATSKSNANSIKDNNVQQTASVRSNTAVATSSAKAVGGDSSLAASFILGEINADVLKSSVYSQFPSLCSMEACAEDVAKLQKLMNEYVDLKTTLARTNSTMKMFYEKTALWREEQKHSEDENRKQTQDLQMQIASLRNENLELKREVFAKMEQIKLSEDMRQKDHAELIQNVSQKNAQIDNMRAQIMKLEATQLASFEYISKHENDTKEQPDYVDRLEHQRIVKDFERQMSALLAENLDLKDVQKQYIDEINCLKVNLTAAEELLKQTQADIQLLKQNDMQKSQIFINYQSERDDLRNEIELLRQQVDVYSKDFTMERAARESMAGEKEQLLQDIRMLQRKNQELIEQSQKHLENVQSAAAAVNQTTAVAAATNENAAAIVAASTIASVSSTSRTAAESISNAATIENVATATTPTSTAAESIGNAASSIENTTAVTTPTLTTRSASTQALPTTASTSANARPPAASLSCPICSKVSQNVFSLQTHVNICLDRAT